MWTNENIYAKILDGGDICMDFNLLGLDWGRDLDFHLLDSRDVDLNLLDCGEICISTYWSNIVGEICITTY